MVQRFEVLYSLRLRGVGNKAFTAEVFEVAGFWGRHKQVTTDLVNGTVTSK